MRWKSLALVLIFLAPASFAKTKKGTLKGVVTGQGSGNLANVHVYLMVDADHLPLLDTRTDFRGRFHFPGIPSGTYTVRLALPGWREKFLDGVEVPAGNIAMLPVELVRDLPTPLNPAPEPQLWNRSNSWDVTFDEIAIRDLPTNRTVGSLVEDQGLSTVGEPLDTAQMQTGTQTLFSSHGASWTENQYLYNGFDASDPYLTGKALVDPDYAALSSVTDVIGAKPANFAAAGNNLVMNVPEPQSNLHGQAGLFYSGRWLQSDNLTTDLIDRGFPGPERLNYLYDANGQVGTALPLGRAELPFFVALSTQRVSNDLGGFDSTIFAHADHILIELTPYQNGGRRLNLLYAGEQQFNSRDGAAIDVSPAATRLRNDNFHQFQARWRDALSPKSVYEAGFGVTHAILSSGLQSGALGTSTLDYPNDILSGSAPLAHAGQRTRYEANAMFQTLYDGFLGSHGFMLGGNFDFSTMSNRWFALNGMEQITVNGAGAQVIQWNTPARDSADVQNFSLFAQDAWRPVRWISFPIGLRLVNSTGKADGVNNRITWTTIEPRLGVVFPVPHVPWVVLHAGWSRYGHQLQGKYLDYGNPAALGGQMFAWDDANHDGVAQPGEIGQLQRVFGGAATGIAKNLSRPYTDEVSIGVDVRLGRVYQVRIRGFERDDHRLIESTDTGVPLSDYTPTVVNDPAVYNIDTDNAFRMLTLYNEKPSALGHDFDTLGNPPGFRSRAIGLDIDMAFRTGKHLEVNGSFTGMATSARTNTSNSVFSNDTGVLNPLGNDPNSLVNDLGLTFFDRGKFGKLAVNYNFPLGFRLSGVMRYYDGLPFSPLLFVNGFNQGPFFVLAVPRTDFVGFRTHFNTTSDIRLSRKFAVWHGVMNANLDIFNFVNLYSSTQEHDLADANLLDRVPLAIQAPRTVRLSVEWSF